ncbi:MAG: SAM-dependent methyltransferase [Acidobacteriia bacterium]|nr:SAM-dependent methyltransferase [Terriglobia bacterium]
MTSDLPLPQKSLNTPLARLIAEQIQEAGPISFRDFMELALYHPELGYYNRSHTRLGKAGDFYTSSHVGPLFGWTIGRAIEKLLAAGENSAAGGPRGSKRPRKPLLIVEFGAGEGFLAKDVLEYFQHLSPSLFERVQYVIVEQSPALRRAQTRLFDQNPDLQKRVRWCTADELEPFSGVVLANEFADALPFHRVVLTDDGYREIFVDLREGGFVEKLGMISSPRVDALIHEVEVEFEESWDSPWPVGQQAEISIDAADWIGSLSERMERGRVVIIDYGDKAGKLYSYPPSQGTVRAFYQHRVSNRYYEHVGEQDLTADVNFSLLLKAAVGHGFEEPELSTQAEFLLENEILKVVEDREGALHLPQEEARNARRQILNLTLPEMMGTRFKVLTLRRGI